MEKQDLHLSDSPTFSIVDSILNSPVVVLQKKESTWSQAWDDFKRASEAAEDDKRNENAAQKKIDHI